VASGDLVAEIGKLKAQEGKPMFAYGGAAFARSLIAHGLVDQFDLMIIPLALGRGRPVFNELTQPRRLTLVSSTAFPKGSVAQVYRPA
jgi:dihydrofolate reductase